MRRVTRLVLALAALLVAPRLGAQGSGSLVSPGKLAKAHAKIEGLDKCQSCHEVGKQVSAVRCLECHKPVGERIKDKKGVHRAVKAAGNECSTCHIEHAGVDGDLRHFEPKGFDHKAETGFPLDGLHAPLKCEACHKARTFLGQTTACASCHKDFHNGTLGATCQTCHPTSVPFKETKKGFDHGKTKYPLTGAHAKLTCETCHKTKGEYRVARYAACDDCHKNPHQPPLAGTCASCHNTETFKKLAEGQKFDHGKTVYPLLGKHAAVACQTCHVKPAAVVHLKYKLCADCHSDPHKPLFPKEDCASCHTESGFKPGKFDHNAKTKFALDGKHATTPCADCHKAAAAQAKVPLAQRVVDFRGAKTECAACHVDVHKGKLGPTCQTCHNTTSFKLSKFEHPRQPAFFLGAHKDVACDKCHLPEPGSAGGPVKGIAAPVVARQYKDTSFKCATCHKDPHLGQVGVDCASCHGITKGFKPDLFVHTRSKFALTGKHEVTPCAKCHTKQTGKFPAGNGTAVRLTGISSECRNCHKDPHLGQLSQRCETCHETKSFKIEKYTHPVKKETTGFFIGKHAKIACADCHRKQTFNYPAGRGSAVRYAVPAECTQCHEDFHKGTLGRDCASCHDPSIWRTASRAFHKKTAFPLEGKHLTTPCASCHLKGVLKGTPTNCYDCHWIRKQDDRFKTKLGTDCATCHRPIGWTAVTWTHATTGFTLETPHKTIACESCHKGLVFKGTARDCYTCHRADYERVKDPNHAAAGFPTDCTGCHKPSSPTWQGATFVHSTFPLAGVHVTQPCAACHKNNVYKGTPRDCYTCHRTDYQNSKNPPHASAAFPTTCDTCHKFSSPNWQDAGFNHNTSTTFPLAGAHVTAKCTACHVNNVFKGTSRDCYTCHMPDYQNSKIPPHVAAGFATTCDACHKFSDLAWKPASFNHNTATTFPLAGTHSTQPCTSCHVNSVFKGTPRDCYACHKVDYQNSKNPPHPASGFPTTCDTCHKFADPAWRPASFNHSVMTTFPLVGLHATQPCTACHVNNVYKGTARDCYTCHKTVYTTSVNPSHTAAGFGTTCDACHRAADSDWHQGTYPHVTWPLVGAHATQVCATCHKNNVFKGLGQECTVCHLVDYQKSVNPPHVAAGFPTTCTTCHKVSDPAWRPSSFNHSTATTFPLAGVHTVQACTACHKAGVFKGTPRDCYGCHQADYQKSVNPPHAAAGFATACDNCHHFSDTAWRPAGFNHNTSTTFPLAGTHITQPCTACHKNNVFKGTPRDCYTCHQADYQKSVNPPHVASGFPTTCDTCHKFSDPAWKPASFNHNTNTTFPLAGTHVTQPCSACHKNNVYKGTARDCYSCHQLDYNNSKNPNHVAAGFPTTCDTCHKFSDAAWKPASFNHNTATTFPLAGVHVTQPCSACHVNNVYKGTARDCYTCHKTDYNNSKNPNHIAAGFPTTCDTCHLFSAPAWVPSIFKH